MNDPRNPFNKLLTVEYLSNMVNGRRVLYNNQSVDVLKELAAASLRDNEVSIAGQICRYLLVFCSSETCSDARMCCMVLRIIKHPMDGLTTLD